MGYHKNIDSKIVIIYISFNKYLLSTSYMSAIELDTRYFNEQNKDCCPP